MVIWISDDSDSDKSIGDWDDDDDELLSSPAWRDPDAPGPSTRVWQDADGSANGSAPSTYSIEDYVAMGFRKEIVLKGIKTIGKTKCNGDGDHPLLELLLTYKELGDHSLVGNHSTSSCTPQIAEYEDGNDSESWNDETDVFESDLSSYGSDVEDFLQDMSQRDKKIRYLLEMGFPEDEAKMAITRCGPDSPISVARSRLSQIKDDNCIDSSLERKKAKLMEDCKKRRKLHGCGAQGNPLMSDCSHEDPVRLPNPMVGFNLPSDPFLSANRRIPMHATGPPFIYFENVALAPKDILCLSLRRLF